MRDQPLSSLSAARRRLLRILQRTEFGRVQVHVVNGEPVYDPPVRIVQDIKLGGGEDGPRREVDLADFILKKQVIELFDHLKRIDSGAVAVITVLHGLPHRLTIEHPANEPPEGKVT